MTLYKEDEVRENVLKLIVDFLIPSSFYSHLPAYEDETNRVFRNVVI